MMPSPNVGAQVMNIPRGLLAPSIRSGIEPLAGGYGVHISCMTLCVHTSKNPAVDACYGDKSRVRHSELRCFFATKLLNRCRKKLCTTDVAQVCSTSLTEVIVCSVRGMQLLLLFTCLQVRIMTTCHNDIWYTVRGTAALINNKRGLEE